MLFLFTSTCNYLLIGKRHWGELARLFKRLRAVQGIEAAKDVAAKLVEFLTPLNAEALKSLYEASEDLIALQSLNVPNTLHRTFTCETLSVSTTGGTLPELSG